MAEAAKPLITAPKIVDETGGDKPKSGSIIALYALNALELGPYGSKTTLSLKQQSQVAGMSVKALKLNFHPSHPGVEVHWQNGEKRQVMLVPWTNVKQLELAE